MFSKTKNAAEPQPAPEAIKPRDQKGVLIRAGDSLRITVKVADITGGGWVALAEGTLRECPGYYLTDDEVSASEIVSRSVLPLDPVQYRTEVGGNLHKDYFFVGPIGAGTDLGLLYPLNAHGGLQPLDKLRPEKMVVASMALVEHQIGR